MEAGLNRRSAGGEEAKRRRIVVTRDNGVNVVALRGRREDGYRYGEFREQVRGRSAIAGQPVQELGRFVVVSLFEMWAWGFGMVIVDDHMVMIVIRILGMEVRLGGVAE